MESSIMQQFKRLSAFFSAVLLTTVLGCAATSTRESTGEYLDDSAITAKVKTAIFHAPGLKSSEINVETFKAVVQLSGFVSSQSDMTQAVRVAEGVGGVKSVKNDMRLK
jgi:osmotically-inducible protein OsmY